ncbi:MAG: amidohydrolase family protein, partial [Clostridia bacterium]|nr:amidohydrolase family protein [Clostridia bacterium]
ITDGTGAESYAADIAVKNGKIVKIGEITDSAETVIDAAGKNVTPGFIDMHNHGDLTAMLCPDMEGLLGQGITSCFCGHCGMTMAPVGDYFMGMLEDVKAFEEIIPLSSYGVHPGGYPAVDAPSFRKAFQKRFGVAITWNSFAEYRDWLLDTGIGCNLYMLVGHAQIRMSVMGLDYKRTATQEEIDRMKELVKEAMDGGALGMSYGLDYAPGIYADDNELHQLAEVLIPYQGILAAHVRHGGKKPNDPDEKEYKPIDGYRDLMEIGLKTGLHVHISHIQNGFSESPEDQYMYDQCAVRTLQIIYEYRAKGCHVTWDHLVPDYIPWFFSPELAGMFKYFIELCGGKKAFAEKLASPVYRRYLEQETKEGRNKSFPFFRENVEILKCKNERFVGRTLSEIAAERKQTPVQTALDLILEDPDTAYRQPPLGRPRRYETKVFDDADDVSLGLDNCAYNYDFECERPDFPVDRSTPTSYCGMITFFEKRSDLPFEKIIQKMTGNAASALGLSDRGRIQEGLTADLLVIDRAHLASNLDMVDPRQKPDGLDYVILNGRIVVDHKEQKHLRIGAIPTLRDVRNK